MTAPNEANPIWRARLWVAGAALFSLLAALTPPGYMSSIVGRGVALFWLLGGQG